MWVSKRYSKILTCLIEIYAARFMPVSSEEMASRMGEPSSTLRKDLQELERLGLVKKTSVSSGRIPTNKAIRQYIKTVCSQREDSGTEIMAVMPPDGDFSVFSRQVLSSLAHETRAIGFVMLDSMFDFPYKGIQILKTGANQVMLVLNGVNGLSFSKIFPTKINYNANALAQWANLLSSEFKGKSLNQSIRCIGNRISRDKERYLKIYRELLSLLEHNDLNVIELLYEGEAQFFQPDHKNQLELQHVIAALKEKSLLIKFLLDMRRQERSGLQVAFGEDTRIVGLDDCMFLFSHFFADTRMIGDMGIIGPRYMPYIDSVSRVRRFSDYFSKRLSGL